MAEPVTFKLTLPAEALAQLRKELGLGEPPPPVDPNAKTYTVVAGDSFYGISRKTGVPVATLYSLNNLNASSVIKPGQVLRLS